MRKSFLIILGGIILCTVFSCGNKKDGKSDEDIIAPVDPRTDFSMERSSQDTTAILDLANNFLQALKSNDIESALSQLYEVDGQEAKTLSRERRNELEKALTALPVVDYTIDELVLYSDSDTEVRYSTEIFKKADGDERPNTTKGSLHPYRINGEWYLTIEPRKVETNYQDN